MCRGKLDDAFAGKRVIKSISVQRQQPRPLLLCPAVMFKYLADENCNISWRKCGVYVIFAVHVHFIPLYFTLSPSLCLSFFLSPSISVSVFISVYFLSLI